MAGRIFAAQVAVWIDGELDRGALTAAVGDVVRQHEILRTRFVRLPGMGVPLQVVDAAGPVEIRSTRILPQEAAESSAIDAAWSDLWNEPFDLESGAGLRVRLFELSLTRHALFLSLPALCSDTAGLLHLVRKIRRSYLGLAGAEADPPFQYADFAAEWNRRAASESRSPSAAGSETGHAPRPALPGEVRPAPDEKFEPHAILLPWPAATSRMLRSFAEERNASLESALLAVWRILLFRLTGESAVVSQVCRDGRIFQELEGALGPFSWPVPVGGSLDESTLFGDVVGDIEQALSHPREAADVPAAETPELGPSPSFEFVDFSEDDTAEATTFRPFRAEASLQRFTIQLSCVHAGGSATVRLRYDATRFPADGAQRIADAFSTLATSVVSNPRSPVRSLNILRKGERKRIVQGFNETERPYDAAVSVAQLFERAAAGPESRVAVVSKRQRLTYLELNQKANRLAAHLRDFGAGPETVVGVCTTRSVHFPLAVLAVLKAGAAWLPLDPSYPAERLSAIARDARPSILLTEAGIGAELFHTAPHAVRIDLDREDFSAHSPENVTERGSPRGAAYVIYTSGSSGQPKGVVLTRGGLANYVQAMGEAIALEPSDVYLHTASIGFSSSVRQLLLPLTRGATCVFASEEDLRDPVRLFEHVQRQGVTVVDLVPSLWRAAMDAMALLDEPDRRGRMDNSLRLLLSASEPLSPELVRRWRTEFRGDTSLINMYGQTETTGIVSLHRIPADLRAGTETVPLGRPIGNVRIHVLDASGEPVPVGVIGEVWIGGAALARGYLNDAASTREAFLPDRFGEDPEARLYRTGDLGVFRADGTLEYRGRRDSQIKIRGFRIEPGEIEATLGRHPGVKDAIAGLRKDRAGEDRLVAWISRRPGAVAGAVDLRGFLKLHVPDYMNPTAFVFVDGLPKTATGKIDRRRLPDPDWRRTGREVERVAPRDELEKALAALWSEVLGVHGIGIHDNFFDSGGHSLAATRVISRTRTVCGVQLPVRVLFECPTVASFAERAREYLEGRPRDSRAEPLLRVSRQGTIPLSFAQERLWFLNEMEPGNPFYNHFEAFRVRGPLEKASLRSAVDAIFERHESLRTTFEAVDGTPVQRVHEPSPAPFSVIDLAETPASEREREARHLAVAEGRRPFDLAHGPLFRITLLRLDAQDHILLVTNHHIISDGWSMAIFFRELAEAYGAFREGRAPSMAPLPIQYADFAAFQRASFRGALLNSRLDYWRKQLAGAPSALRLPVDRRRPPVQRYVGAQTPFEVPENVLEALRGIGREEGATSWMTLLASFQALLFRYTGEDDIVVGSPIASRDRPEIEPLIGLFINTVVLRTDFSGKPSFREVLRRVRKVALGAYSNQEIPFEELMRQLQVERTLSGSPLFQVMFIQDPEESTPGLPGLAMSRLAVDIGTSKFDLTLTLREEENRVTGFFSYNTDLFDAETIQEMVGCFRVLLEGISKNPDLSLATLPLLGEEETRRTLAGSAGLSARESLPSVSELVQARAMRSPEAQAIVSGARQLTYGELDRRAEELAWNLRAIGVGPDTVVAICLERSPELIIGVLGILKAGGAYLPLDPRDPVQRLSSMLEDALPRALLTTRQIASRFVSPALPILFVDDGPPGEARSQPERWRAPRLDEMAYVIYTSGSTGEPKGVEIEHGSLTNYVAAACDSFGLTPRDRVLQFAAINFDTFAEEVFPCLVAGGTLVLRTDSMLEAIPVFLAECAERGITVLDLPTAYWHELVSGLEQSRLVIPESVRLVIIGGERALPERLALWHRHVGSRVRLLNTYGPTEATVAATACDLTDLGEDPGLDGVPLGRPIRNAQVYVLDRGLGPVPPGIPGEICIGGIGLARGYLRNPALTKERFIENPFEAGRLYRTGDLGRYRRDGNLAFLGRVDEQVKVRGFRVELGEVETELARQPGVREAVVIAREDESGRNRLLAYVQPAQDPAPSPGELRRRLREKLPDYMVPSAFVTVPSFPRTSSGKVDRRALPEPEPGRRDLDGAPVAPRTPAETAVAAIWKEVLGVETIGVHDNFFDLGGHSLLVARVVFRVRNSFKRDVPFRWLFESPTVAGLAERLSAVEREEIARLIEELESSPMGQPDGERK